MKGCLFFMEKFCHCKALTPVLIGAVLFEKIERSVETL